MRGSPRRKNASARSWALRPPLPCAARSALRCRAAAAETHQVCRSTGPRSPGFYPENFGEGLQQGCLRSRSRRVSFRVTSHGRNRESLAIVRKPPKNRIRFKRLQWKDFATARMNQNLVVATVREVNVLAEHDDIAQAKRSGDQPLRQRATANRGHEAFDARETHSLRTPMK